jgi:hypothetical protein
MLGFIRQLDMSMRSDMSIRIYSLSRHIAKPHVQATPPVNSPKTIPLIFAVHQT